ncbi:MAG: prepilin-type N-terminal cleavage/methylation domain-containing protein [Deltaproteobacteria bacterium]|nr:prepilin-type N-terminal cleavage/methylation domain-containing protein [Deltaproteobacteria bacterium]MBW2065383.1 prepilin-type N-terminal cleavage/methylation domain-containing protein [Deltaproteobacteria bacterium]
MRRSKVKGSVGFTLLEVMIAMAIIAIVLTAVLGSQSQSVSFANEAKFYTTASLLAQSKMAEWDVMPEEELISDSGDFGEDFPGYSWHVSVSNVILDMPGKVPDYLKRVDVQVSWGDEGIYQYRVSAFRFLPERQ